VRGGEFSHGREETGEEGGEEEDGEEEVAEVSEPGPRARLPDSGQNEQKGGDGRMAKKKAAKKKKK
jgi:hypothetical protein